MRCSATFKQEFQYFQVRETVIEFDAIAGTLRDLSSDYFAAYPMPDKPYEILGIGSEKNYLNIFYKQHEWSEEVLLKRASLNDGVITFY